MPIINQQVLIKSMPVGLLQLSNFELIKKPLLTSLPKGKFLVRALWLSLDPYVRSLLSGRHFLNMPQKGDLWPAAAVAEVIESQHAVFKSGELVVLPMGLQAYTISDGTGVWKLSKQHVPPSTALGILGMPGMTAYFGLNEIAHLKSNETVVVSAASGPVGSMVGQITRLRGARVIGIAGSEEKCNWARENAKFFACINYKTENVDERLRSLAPNGVDVFFDNSGGELQNLIIGGRHLALKGRVVLCGLIDQYSKQQAPPGPNLGPLMACRGRIEPIIVYDYEDRREEFLSEALAWYAAGELVYKEDIRVGLEYAGEHFCRLMRGENFGKSLIQLC